MKPLVAPTANPAMVMPSMSTKGSPSMIMRSAYVPLSPSSALQTMYFWSAEVFENRLPLDAGGKTCAASPAQPGVGDFLHQRFRRHRQRALQALITVAAHVIRQRKWIDNAAACEGQPLLLFEVGNLFGGSQTERVRACLPESPRRRALPPRQP